MPPPDGPTPPARNRAASAALSFGLVAVAFTFVPIGGDFVALPSAICAVTAGVIGSGRVDRGQASNRRAAVAGGVLGVLVLLSALVMFLVRGLPST